MSGRSRVVRSWCWWSLGCFIFLSFYGVVTVALLTFARRAAE
jgi:hypothetical protein